MPFYDYICSECGKIFDRMLPMDRRNEPQVCPECGGTAVRKAVSTFSSSGASCAGSSDGCSGG